MRGGGRCRDPEWEGGGRGRKCSVSGKVVTHLKTKRNMQLREDGAIKNEKEGSSGVRPSAEGRVQGKGA